jgi:hypothetical protein
MPPARWRSASPDEGDSTSARRQREHRCRCRPTGASRARTTATSRGSCDGLQRSTSAPLVDPSRHRPTCFWGHDGLQDRRYVVPPCCRSAWRHCVGPVTVIPKTEAAINHAGGLSITPGVIAPKVRRSGGVGSEPRRLQLTRVGWCIATPISYICRNSLHPSSSNSDEAPSAAPPLPLLAHWDGAGGFAAA